MGGTPPSKGNGIMRFDREFFASAHDFTYIGSGELGGKARGLAQVRAILAEHFAATRFPGITVNVPRLTVLTTDAFDAFLERNRLHEVAFADLPDDRIAHAFQRADLPSEVLGDLMALVASVHQPLAVRSSSLLEDALQHPFAGVYATKMIPNRELDPAARFRQLVEAIKLVYASTFFADARSYAQSTGHRLADEKMAVIIQEIVGSRHADRFYPDISGVARSFSFYPIGRARREEGVVSLALGLGKTIVDGGISWTYSPAYPTVPPPFASARDLLARTQTEFWAVNMGRPPAYDPIHETEYLVACGLTDAEADGTLRLLASSYDPQSDRITPGLRDHLPRALTFAPILEYGEVRLNDLVSELLRLSSSALGQPVEIEIAMSLDPSSGATARLGFLQLRPMLVTHETVDVEPAAWPAERVLLAADSVLGNGSVRTIRDVVFVRRERFALQRSRAIAQELAEVNARLVSERRPYALIGFGRFGSSDPWLGIPVTWAQIAGAKAVVEAMLPGMAIELSQGSHFFHNLLGAQVSYFSLAAGEPGIRWEWLERQPAAYETEHVLHVQLDRPLTVLVDGRSGRGVILHD